jgi:predicted outer membrane repeat protein
VTITGPGASSLTISGNNTFEVFYINLTVSVSISGLTITNGRSSGNGGGIYSNGVLTLTNAVVSNNSANYGGGIYNPGSLTLINSTVSGNSASGDGGGVHNTLPTSVLILTNSKLRRRRHLERGHADRE